MKNWIKLSVYYISNKKMINDNFRERIGPLESNISYIILIGIMESQLRNNQKNYQGTLDPLHKNTTNLVGDFPWCDVCEMPHT